MQQWIADGKPTSPPGRYCYSPLRVAVQTGFHSMIELLLRAGVDQDEKDYLLHHAVWNANFEVIQLLAKFGADLTQVDFDDACRTGNPLIMRFFLAHGADPVARDAFATALRRPLRTHLSIYMAFLDTYPGLKRQANLALRYHAQTGNLKWVRLLLWAGANPHERLPDIGREPDRHGLCRHRRSTQGKAHRGFGCA